VIIPIPAFENENDLNTVVGILKRKVDLSRYKKQATKIKYKVWIIPIIVVSCCLIYVFFGNTGINEKQSRAWNFEKNNDFESALVLYNELIASEPDNINYILSRANCEINLSEFDRAISDCETAIKTDPTNGRAYYYYAHALYNNEQYDKACEAIHKSISTGYTTSTEDFCE